MILPKVSERRLTGIKKMCNETFKKNEHGAFIISLDFELQYGVEDHDLDYLKQYKKNILGVRQVIPKILSLFDEFDMRATWAIVGMLLAESKDELFAFMPTDVPQYTNSDLSVYNYLDRIGNNEDEDKCHYGLSLARKILNVPGQEIATHTFSHMYCNDMILVNNAMVEDLVLAKKITREKLGVDPVSIVFPRNQINESCITVLSDLGFTAYRGCPSPAVYNSPQNTYDIRFRRLMDSYFMIYGSKTQKWGDVYSGGVCNVAASSFLRPYSEKFSFMEKLKMNVIKRSMEYAAVRGEAFHLWWHPHNFGVNVEKNISNLTNILSHYKKMKEKYGMLSMNMNDVVNSIQ